MMMRRCIGLALGLIIGIVMARLHLQLATVLLAPVAAAGGLLSLLSLRDERRWRPWHPALVTAAALALALPPGYWRASAIIDTPGPGSVAHALAPLTTATRIGLRGHISREPELRIPGQLDLQLRVNEIRVGNTGDWQPVKRGEVRLRIFTLKGNSPDSHERLNVLAAPQAYGYRIEASADYRPVDDRLNPADFNFSGFLLQEGADASLRCHAARTTILESTRGNPLMELALAAKTDFLDTFKQTIRAPASRFAAAATLGTRRAVEHTNYLGRNIADTFRHAGVGHVLAVSGLHVSVIAILLFALFRMTGASPRLFVPPLITFLILFALLTGARPSSLRAVIMNSVILIAFAYFRCNFRAATAIGLSLSSFLILLLNPVVLFSPSFLLSFGAVLSLVMLTPPVDRFLRSLRGACLLVFIAWFVLLMAITISRIHWLANLPNTIALAALLWILLSAGTRLNQRFPRLWSIGTERVPNTVRLFVSAQLAIQIGMMIPLSAWFFGQFPVAGILVNLAAIPAIGILVQLGMLTGLIGLIPLVGPWLALPVGVAVTIVGEAFLLLAWLGAYAFPFPALPHPTPGWMLAYYGLLGLALIAEQQRHILLDRFYRLFARLPRRLSRATAVLPLLLLLPLLAALPGRLAAPITTRVDILSAGNYPLVVISGSGTADLINAGARIEGECLLFDSIRSRGATRVRNVLLPSPDARAGIQGATALLGKMPIGTLHLPVLPAPAQTLTEAIGDAYLLDQARQGTSWARQYDTAFAALRTRAGEAGTRLAAIGSAPLADWRNLSLTPLPRLQEQPTRFASSAITPLLRARIHGLDWIIVTDTTPEAVLTAIEGVPSCDVLVVPDLSHFRTYAKWLEHLLRNCPPRLLVVAGSRPLENRLVERLLPDGCLLIQTGLDGAVSATFQPDGSTRLTTYRTRRDLRLDASKQPATQQTRW